YDRATCSSLAYRKTHRRIALLLMILKNKKGEAFQPRLSLKISGLVRRSGFRHDVDPAAILVEEHFAVGEREQGPVAARTHVLAGDELAAALAHQDAAGGHELAAKFFHAQPFAD